MFELIITPEQNKKAEGFVTIWSDRESGDTTRVTLEAISPSDTETEEVSYSNSLLKFGALRFGGLANNGQWPTIRVTFDEGGAFRKAEAI